MTPIPTRMPLWTASLLLGGMAIFILKGVFPFYVEIAFVVIGTAVFFAGMVVALVGAVWSICTLTNVLQRRHYGVTTPVCSILVALLAWSGTVLTVYKFKGSHVVRTNAATAAAAEPRSQAVHSPQ
jgi:hypothetical protein